MSNDSQKPENQPSGKSTPPSKPPQKDTETDLWDLEDDKDISSPRPRQPSIPSRRSSESPIRSKKPVERDSEATVAAEKTVKEAPSPAILEDEEKDAETTEEQPPSDSPAEKGASSETSSPEGSLLKEFLNSLTKIEKIGISVLVAILALTATLSIIHFSNRVPLKPLIAEDLDLPIEGKVIKVTSVATFWREPITEGEDRDVVRRGVKLIPVIRMGIEGKSGAIRVLFRNENGAVVGDNISRPVTKKASLEISATDGFNDIGMHAAYRTGESDRWVVQVLEGPTVNAPMDNFRIVFETEVSTDMR